MRRNDEDVVPIGRTVRFAGVKAVFDERKMTLDFSDTLEMDNAVLPCVYEVCGACSGRGTTTRHIEAEGGGFTSSEWAEMCDGDPDFAEDYFSGAYDRDCPDCDGRRVCPVPKDDIWKSKNPVAKELRSWIRSEQQYRAEVAAERRMGA